MCIQTVRLIYIYIYIYIYIFRHIIGIIACTCTIFVDESHSSFAQSLHRNVTRQSLFALPPSSIRAFRLTKLLNCSTVYQFRRIDCFQCTRTIRSIKVIDIAYKVDHFCTSLPVCCTSGSRDAPFPVRSPRPDVVETASRRIVGD